ncbi:MAG: hypothetical protein RL591_1246 [Planctomycetota bacterium]|jgi:hypothetical protein
MRRRDGIALRRRTTAQRRALGKRQTPLTARGVCRGERSCRMWLRVTSCLDACILRDPRSELRGSTTSRTRQREASDHLLPSERTSGHHPFAAGEYSGPSHSCHRPAITLPSHRVVERQAVSQPVLKPVLEPFSNPFGIRRLSLRRPRRRAPSCDLWHACERHREFACPADLPTFQPLFLAAKLRLRAVGEIGQSPDEIGEPKGGERRSLCVRWQTARKLGTAGRAASETFDETYRRNLPTKPSSGHASSPLSRTAPTHKSALCVLRATLPRHPPAPHSHATRAHRPCGTQFVRIIPGQAEPNRRTTSSTFARELNALMRK